jgi:hypothetical protein
LWGRGDETADICDGQGFREAASDGAQGRVSGADEKAGCPIMSGIRHRLAAKLFYLALAGFLWPGTSWPMPPAEETRVERLLRTLGQEKDLRFIRNGTEYPVSRAEEHLRLKFERSRAYLDSAEDFIDRAGARSSVSGQPDLVRHPGREPVPAGSFLRDLLRRIEASPEESQVP